MSSSSSSSSKEEMKEKKDGESQDSVAVEPLKKDEEDPIKKTPSKKAHADHEVTLLSSFIFLAKSSWLNVLLVFVPVGIVIGALKLNGVAVFVINFISIIPLAKLLGESTEQLAMHTSQSLGGLLNATFGNAVEIIISIIALKDGLIRVVQSSLVGSILSNLLLVLGMAFAAGGYYRKTLKFNQTAAQTSSGVLFIAVLGVVLPVALKVQVADELAVAAELAAELALLHNATNVTNATNVVPLVIHESISTKNRMLVLSRGASIIMLIIYGLFLFFQLSTHAELYADQDGEEEETSEMTILGAILGLAIVTAIVAVCSEYLVGSIDALTLSWGISETFAGMILLPIVGNAAEHLTAVTVAMKGKMDLSIGVAVGSSQQIAMLVIPLMVILGWIIGQEMSLYFEVFETAVLFMTIIVVYVLINDGESNWLEGAMLLGVYIIMAIAFYVV